MTRWELEPTPVRSISPETSARVWAAKGLLLGEDRPDDDRCTGCLAASCEPCRQVSALSVTCRSCGAEGFRLTFGECDGCAAVAS